MIPLFLLVMPTSLHVIFYLTRMVVLTARILDLFYDSPFNWVFQLILLL